MSDQTPPEQGFGDPFDDGASSRGRLDGRALRALLAGAAGVAVIGGGALGFVWLSSAPGADSASAAPVVSGGVTTSAPSASPTTSPVDFALAGRDVFVPLAGSGVAQPTGSVDGGGTTSATTSGGTGKVGGTGTSVATSAATHSVGKPSNRPVTSTTSPAVRTPTATRSTAPAWEVPSVGFVSGTADYGVFDVDGERVTVPKGALIYPLSVRYDGIVVESTDSATATATATPSPTGTAAATVTGKFSQENNPGSGWLVTSNAEKPTPLPAAALGKVTGQVRLTGVLRDQFWVRVDRQDDVLLPAKSAVGTTGLTLIGAGDKRVPSASAAFSDAAGTIYYGSMGEGTSDGVLY